MVNRVCCWFLGMVAVTHPVVQSKTRDFTTEVDSKWYPELLFQILIEIGVFCLVGTTFVKNFYWKTLWKIRRYWLWCWRLLSRKNPMRDDHWGRVWNQFDINGFVMTIGIYWFMSIMIDTNFTTHHNSSELVRWTVTSNHRQSQTTARGLGHCIHKFCSYNGFMY